MNRDGKGVEGIEDRKPTLTFFFKLYFRKFTQLLQLNLIMLLMVIPLLVVLFVFLLGQKTPTVTSFSFAPLYGMATSATDAGLWSLLDSTIVQMEIPIYSPAMNILRIAMFVILAVCWGWLNAGAAYVARGLVKGEPVFVMSDFIYAIKRNFKQGFFLGLLDFIFCAVLITDFLYYYNLTGSFMLDFMYFAIFALIIIYFIMRFYIYLLLITFDIKTFKIFKNALIFTVLGIKRNLLAFFGIILLLAIHIVLIFVLLPFGISVPIVLPFVYIMATFLFISTYAAYPIIDKYMIDPYKSENAELDDTPDGVGELNE
jgi:uncharacterized membrane protein YesL